MRIALERLYALGPGKMQPGRERLRRLLKKAGDPHLAVPAVLVGGTNGKGRVVAGLSAALKPHLKCGAFIKPHLQSIRERWRIDDAPVSEELFTSTAHATCDLIEEHDEPISFFEANVLLGALLFRDTGCNLAIWEVGLGGREDACNLVDPLVSVLTNVGYDHQQILGDSLGEIARDKAHIARPGRPLLLSPPRPGWDAAYNEYAPVIESVCTELGAILQHVEPASGDAWQRYLANKAQGIPPDSLSLIAAAVERLTRVGIGPDPSTYDLDHMPIYYPGRMDLRTLENRPVLIDAAHNIDSLRWLSTALGAGYDCSGFPVIFGCQVNRDPRELLAQLVDNIDVLIPIEVPVMHPCPTAKIIDSAESLGLPVSLPPGKTPGSSPGDYQIGHNTELDPPDNRTGWIESVRHGLSFADDARPTVICGSIYYIGEILRAFNA